MVQGARQGTPLQYLVELYLQRGDAPLAVAAALQLLAACGDDAQARPLRPAPWLQAACQSACRWRFTARWLCRRR